MTVSRHVLGAMLAFSVVAALGNGCSGCRRGDSVAELLAIDGRAERGAGGVTSWSAASVGTHFAYGDALRTAAASRARVRIGENGTLHVGPSSTVRFLRQRSARGGAPRGLAVRVDQGEAEVETTATMEIETEGGTARVERGSRLRIGRAIDETYVQVTVGRVVLERVGGEVLDVGAGQQVVVTVSRAQIEPFVPDVGDAGAAHHRSPGRVRTTPDAAALDALVAVSTDANPDALVLDGALGTASATSTVDASLASLDASDAGDVADPRAQRAPNDTVSTAPTARADLVITAGESTTVHFTGENLHLGLRMEPECTGTLSASAVGHTNDSPPGARYAVVVLPSGFHRYALRCSQPGSRDRSAAGSVRVSHDTGAGSLPHAAPRSSVDADGRRYTVLFQSVAPELTFRWPRAPAGASFTLNVRSAAGRTQSWRVGSAARTIASGGLSDGTYTFWFQAVGRRERSPDTSLVLSFDNTARAAQIREPRDGIAAGASVRVSGAVLAGGTVSASGTRIPTDPTGRFDGEARVPSDGTSLAIRITLPGRGVHYYLRRVAGAGP